MHGSTYPERHMALKRIGVGPGGLKCACCAPPKRIVKKMLRSARRIEKHLALKVEDYESSWQDAWETPTWFDPDSPICIYRPEYCDHRYMDNGKCFYCGTYNWLHDRRPDYLRNLELQS